MTNYQEVLSSNLNVNARAGAKSINTYISALSKFEEGVPVPFIHDFLDTNFRYFVLVNLERIDFKNKIEKLMQTKN